jgi:hypothetical protein
MDVEINTRRCTISSNGLGVTSLIVRINLEKGSTLEYGALSPLWYIYGPL